MRIASIDLTAFGPFTNTALDLSASGTGLNVIFGLNEAGKSSALRAIYALLFGIDRTTPDNFIHAYQDLKLAARLENSLNVSIEFLRIKRDKHSLLDPITLEPLSETALVPFLGNVSKETFKTLFKIGHAELREGGEDLARGKGDFGEILFQASAGGRQMRTLLDDMEKAADELFRPRATTAKLNKALSDLKDSQTHLSQCSLSYNAWKNLNKEVQQKREELERLKIEDQEKTAQLSRLDRIIGVAPSACELKETLKALDERKGVLILPDDFGERRKNVAASRERAARAQERSGKQAAIVARKARFHRNSGGGAGPGIDDRRVAPENRGI